MARGPSSLDPPMGSLLKHAVQCTRPHFFLDVLKCPAPIRSVFSQFSEVCVVHLPPLILSPGSQVFSGDNVWAQQSPTLASWRAASMPFVETELSLIGCMGGGT